MEMLLGFNLPVEGSIFNISQERDSIGSEYSAYGTINTEAPKETLEFGQLAGLWDCISKDLVKNENGEKKWFTNKAIWKWEYILGGHALLNQWWQEDNSPNPITKEYFASGIFIFNPNTRLWEAVVMNSRPHKLSPKFEAKCKDGKILMHDGTGKWLVTFFNISKQSFEWKYEVLSADGHWEAISTISAKRGLEKSNNNFRK